MFNWASVSGVGTGIGGCRFISMRRETQCLYVVLFVRCEVDAMNLKETLNSISKIKLCEMSVTSVDIYIETYGTQIAGERKGDENTVLSCIALGGSRTRE